MKNKNHFNMTRMAHCFSSTALCCLFALICINMKLINGQDDSKVTKWAVLVAGSNEYYNYRHQADVCHAYQLLKKGGLKDENIVVFMYDDIAYNEDNPRPGVIINKPKGEDVYNGVPKDYIGEEVNVNNFFAVLLGNKSAVKGGSGKVVDSGPNDHIFVYYTDHGGSGVLGMPNDGDLVYAGELNAVLKTKHASGTYKKMVFYVEACESGSIFEGLLSKDINIYATTASNADENSYATYCPDDDPSPAPKEYDTCLGDMYSVAWLEDSDKHNRRIETLKKQYQLVKNRTARGSKVGSSHVMRYGDLKMSNKKLSEFMGSNTVSDDEYAEDVITNEPSSSSNVVNQRDADIVHFWGKFIRAPQGSTQKMEAQKQLAEILEHRVHVDESIKQIGELYFKDQRILNTIRTPGQPLVDDWDCLRSLVRMFETHCGSLSKYGLKHMRALANICNYAAASAATNGEDIEKKMTEIAATVCPSFPTNPRSSLKKRSNTA